MGHDERESQFQIKVYEDGIPNSMEEASHQD